MDYSSLITISVAFNFKHKRPIETPSNYGHALLELMENEILVAWVIFKEGEEVVNRELVAVNCREIFEQVVPPLLAPGNEARFFAVNRETVLPQLLDGEKQ